MNVDKRWLFLVTMVAIAGAVLASTTRRRQRRSVHELEHKENLTAWENEGGNLAPVMVAQATQ